MSELEYQAFVLQKDRKLKLEKRCLRKLAPFEVAIKVEIAGICGTDLAIISGQYKGLSLPLVLGHEFVGRVERIGAKVSRWNKGDLVVAEINNHCAALRRDEFCPNCRKGIFKHCKVRTVLGISGADGAFAEYVIVPAENLHSVREELSLEESALIEPMAAALETFKKCPIKAGEKILISGAGRLGCLITAVVRSKGGVAVALSRSQERRAFAELFGAHYTYSPSENLGRIVKKLTGGLGFDAVVEVSGDPSSLPTLLTLLRSGGRVYLKSTSGVSAPLPLTQIVVDELPIYPSRCGNFRDAMEFLAKEKLPIQVWIKKFKFKNLKRAISEAKKPGKVLIYL